MFIRPLVPLESQPVASTSSSARFQHTACSSRSGRRSRRRVVAPLCTIAPDRSSDLARTGAWADVEALRRSFNAESLPIRRQRPQLLSKNPLDKLKKANDCGDCSKEESHPSMGWSNQPHHLNKHGLWARIREEAQADAIAEPMLSSSLHSNVLSHYSLESSLAFVLAAKLSTPTFPLQRLSSLIQEAYEDDPDLIEQVIADMHAVVDRDPACSKYTQLMLCFKGFQALQVYRIGHWLWSRGRQALAVAVQSRGSAVFSVDIHPAATLGRGIMIDHGTGVVIGETAVLGDNVSMLHHVTLGGSGISSVGIRHPTIGHGVLLGAGVVVLGPITIGAGSKVGAGSVVVSELPCHCVAVGIPARIIKRDTASEPCRDMDQVDFILDYVI